jgi:hypothetical protein
VNAGPKKIRIKYRINSKSFGSLVIEFRSKIKIYNGGNNLVYEGQYSGLDREA